MKKILLFILLIGNFVFAEEGNKPYKEKFEFKVYPQSPFVQIDISQNSPIYSGFDVELGKAIC